MTDTHFEIHDRTLPTDGPLAVATAYAEALRQLAALHERFWAQLDANGEGSASVLLRLAVTQIERGKQPRTVAISTARRLIAAGDP